MNDGNLSEIDWRNPDWTQEAKRMMAEFTRVDEPQLSATQTMQKLEFCLQFIQARNDMKLTQVQLAEKAGVTQAMIARLESGKVSTTYTTLMKVAEALDRRVILTGR